MALGAAAVVVAAVLLALRGGGRRDVPVDPALVVVAPFDVADPGLELWRDGMVDVLSLNLDGAGPLRTVSAIRQKLASSPASTFPHRAIRSGGRPISSRQIDHATASSVYATAWNFSYRSLIPKRMRMASVSDGGGTFTA